ncbi:hypothetical protein EDD11_005378 [Mortierella claussenii]|nr:hypothetical protein EDD11_005378 [Mortierella claussenii]
MLWWRALEVIDVIYECTHLRRRQLLNKRGHKHPETGGILQSMILEEQQQDYILTTVTRFQQAFTKDLDIFKSHCTVFCTSSTMALEILLASGCDFLTRLEFGMYNVHQYDYMSGQVALDRINALMFRNRELQHLSLRIPSKRCWAYQWNRRGTQSTVEAILPSSTSTFVTSPSMFLELSMQYSALKSISIANTMLTLDFLKTLLESCPDLLSLNLININMQSQTIEEGYPRHVILEPHILHRNPNAQLVSVKVEGGILYEQLIWSLVIYSPVLESFHCSKLMYADPVHAGYTDLTVMDVIRRIAEPLNSLRSLHLTHWRPRHNDILKSLLKVLPRLEDLQLMYIRLHFFIPVPPLAAVDATTGEGTVMDATVELIHTEATIDNNSGSHTTDTREPSFFLPYLRRVVLVDLQGPGITVNDHFRFLRSLPALEYARVKLETNLIIDEMQPRRVVDDPASLSSSFFLLPKNDDDDDELDSFRNTRSIELILNPGHRSILAKIFRCAPKCTSVQLYYQPLPSSCFWQNPVLRSRCLQQNQELEQGQRQGRHQSQQQRLQGPLWLRELLRRHQETLTSVSFQDPRVPNIDDAALLILQRCQRLKHFQGGSGAVAVRCTEENMSDPWACKDLETLKVFMDCNLDDDNGNSNNNNNNNNDDDDDDVDEDINSKKSSESRFQCIQRALFKQLGSLSKLRTLAISGGGDLVGVDYSLKTGLNLLEALTELEELDARVTDLKDSTTSLFLDDEAVFKVCEAMEQLAFIQYVAMVIVKTVDVFIRIYKNSAKSSIIDPKRGYIRP